MYVYYHEQNVRITKRIISSDQNRRVAGAFVTTYDILYMTLTM